VRGDRDVRHGMLLRSKVHLRRHLPVRSLLWLPGCQRAQIG
jgi:hypothetical protein